MKSQNATQQNSISQQVDEMTVQMVSEQSVIWQDVEKRSTLSDQGLELIEARWDDNAAVVRSYVTDLEKQNNATAREQMIQAFRTGNFHTQKIVCKSLIHMGKDAVEVLVEYMIRADGTVHQDIFQTLRLHLDLAVPVLLEILQGKSRFQVTAAHKIAAFKILSFFPNAKVSAYLCGNLVSLDPKIRRASAEALYKQGRAAEKPLLVLLNESPAGHRCHKYCVYLLGRMRSQRAVSDLIRFFCKETNPHLACLEAWALGQIGRAEAVGPLLFVLEERKHSWLVMRTIVAALGNLGSEEAVESLVPFLEDRGLRESVIEALGKIGSRKSLEALKPYMKSQINYLRYLTVSALLQMGDSDALKVMVEGLADPDPRVQKHTEKALSQFYSPEEIDEIYQRFEEKLQRDSQSPWQRLMSIKSPAPQQSQDSSEWQEPADFAPAFEDEFSNEDAWQPSPLGFEDSQTPWPAY